MTDLYSVQLAADDAALPPEVESLMKQLFADLEAKKLNQGLFNFTFKRLLNAIETPFQKSKDLDTFIEQLRTNAAVFSAFKTHTQQKELVKLLVDPNGKARSFAQFKKAATPILKDYNVTYLRAEHQLATRQARAAENWKQWEAQADVYPNLEYTPSRAANPSEDHKEFYGIILPLTHEFWAVIPPSRWGCQCGVRPSRKETNTKGIVTLSATKGSRSKGGKHISRDAGIAGNAGKSGQIFSADHPFIKSVSSSARTKIKEAIPSLRKNFDSAK